MKGRFSKSSVSAGRLPVLAAVALLAVLWGFGPARAVYPPVDPPSEAIQRMPKQPNPSHGGLSLEELRGKRAAAEASKALTEAVKKNVLGLLDQAIRFLETVEQLNGQTAVIMGKVKGAPDRVKMIQKELEQPLPPLDFANAPAPGVPTENLEQQIQEAEAGLAEAKADFNRWTDELDTRKKRPEQIRTYISKARKRLAALREQMKSDPSGESAEGKEALAAARMAEQAKCQAEIAAYEQELAVHEVLMSLLTAEHDLASRKVVVWEVGVKSVRVRTQKRQEQEATEARKEAETAKKQARDLPSALGKQFDINVRLGEQLEKLTEAEFRLKEKLDRAGVRLRELEEDFTLARQRVDSAVLTEAIGLALREQRNQLPDLNSYRQDSAQRRLKMAQIRESQLDIDLKRRGLMDFDTEIERVTQSLGVFTLLEAEGLKTEVRGLLIDRRDLLEKLQAGYRRFFKGLQDIEFAEQQLTSRAEEFAAFLDRHLLWIRSTRAIGPADLKRLPAAIEWMTRPENWRQVLRDAARSVGRNPGRWMLGMLLAGTLLAAGRFARGDLARVAKRAGGAHKNSFLLILRTFLMTAVLAAGWPFALGFAGVQLRSLPGIQDFSLALSMGVINTSLVGAAFGFFYQMCRDHGAAQVHFGWPDRKRNGVRRTLTGLAAVTLPLLFVTWALDMGKEPKYSDSLGRIAFIGAMLAAAVRLLGMPGGSDAPPLSAPGRSAFDRLGRLRFIARVPAVGIPLVLGSAAGAGYFHTALTLLNRTLTTLWVLAGLVVVNGLAGRWVSAAGLGSNEDPARSVPDLDDGRVRRLPRGGWIVGGLMLWWIWAPVLPGLDMIENLRLWSCRIEVDGVAQTLPVTLKHLFAAAGVAALTVVAAGNLPGLLETMVLIRIPLDTGARYAVTAMCRYAIAAGGSMAALGSIGFNWAKLQWLLAALGVGVGFGLQEIVANFVCGLIVLFERPFRVGDVVTVDGIMGTVTRIRMRATTITDLDRRELIVPNKDFITGRLVNWSLSDPITRVVIPVGIAYGADTVSTEKLLVKVAREHPLVRDDPKPCAWLLGFGDSTLNFELWVYVGRFEDRIPVTHALHQAIECALGNAGITLAFPQQDVHLDASRPLQVHVVSDIEGARRPGPPFQNYGSSIRTVGRKG